MEVMLLGPIKLTGLEKFSGLAPLDCDIASNLIKLALVKTNFQGCIAHRTEKVTLPPVPARRVNAVAR
jgi:hypothetical protein